MSQALTCLSCDSLVDELLGNGLCPTCLLSPVQKTAPSHPSSYLGQTLADRYHLTRVIGRGGMGIVYEAQQTEPVTRQVAVKVIKPGMDSFEILKRFEAERQILALLDHPHIARILDGGITEQGHPYFVMDFAGEESLPEFLEKHPLTLAEKLTLFLQICEALTHAHQRGIIHRDLKPGNILITGREPKVIDFGIAKSLEQNVTDLTLQTIPGQFLGTPAYASPEQLLGQPSDTRSDIYSLGALLYHLLADQPPISTKELANIPIPELHRLLAVKDPVRPSQRSPDRNIPQDLDWITMRALEKDPEARYATVTELAEDIQRHLDDLPIHASSPSLTYRLRKFTRRHRWPVATATAILLALLTGVTTTTLQAARAKRSEADMAEQKERADHLVGYMLNNHFSRLDQLGDQALKVSIARTVIADLSDIPERLLTLENQSNLGLAYRKAGSIFFTAGEWEDAVDACAKGEQTWAQVRQKDPGNLWARYHQGHALEGHGRGLERMHELQRSRASYHQAADILKKLVDDAPISEEVPLWPLKLRTVYAALGRAYEPINPPKGVEFQRKGMEVVQYLEQHHPADPGVKEARKASLQNLAMSLRLTDPQEALIVCKEALVLVHELVEDHNRHPDYITGIGVIQSILSDIYIANEDYPSAIHAREETAQIYRTYNHQYPEQTNIPQLLASQLLKLGEIKEQDGQTQSALADLEEAKTILKEIITRLGQKAPAVWNETLLQIDQKISQLTR